MASIENERWTHRCCLRMALRPANVRTACQAKPCGAEIRRNPRARARIRALTSTGNRAHTRTRDRGMLAAIMPYRERTSKLILSLLLSCALLPACDKKDDAKQDDKKEPEKSEQDKELEERLAAKKAAREAEAKAAEDKANAIKALAELPEPMPKNLEK